MKRKIIAFLFGLVLCATASGQVNGSGTIITKNYDFRDFDKVVFRDLNGKIEVEIGKPWSVRIDIDDNLVGLLDVRNEANEHQLAISLTGNHDSRLYIERTNIKIKITMPEASVITNGGNSDINIKNINGRYFRIENRSNGNATIFGRVDMLDAVNNGNGDIDAQNLKTKTAEVTTSGNGDIVVCANERITASVSGNGNVINTGTAAFPKNASSGNGQLIHRNPKR